MFSPRARGALRGVGRFFVGSLGALLCACTTPPGADGDRSWFDRLRSAHEFRERKEFALPTGWSDALEPPAETGAVREGDGLLYLARLESARGTEHNLVAVTAGPARSDDAEVRLLVDVFDLHAQRVGHAEHTVRQMYLSTGLHAAAREMLHPRERLEPTEIGPVVAGIHAVRAVLALVEDDATLSALLRQVIETPSLWSLVAHAGVTATVEMGRPEPVAPWPELEVTQILRSPITLLLNRIPALRCSVLSIEPRAPYCVVGGVIAVIAERPEAPNVRFELHLLASRRAR